MAQTGPKQDYYFIEHSFIEVLMYYKTSTSCMIYHVNGVQEYIIEKSLICQDWTFGILASLQVKYKEKNNIFT